ncbi:MAG: HAD-IA family hydrolase [Ignavibacteriaceae bacterium]|nr:HAD-IA family hydrolase [Ignavibacteriaceae bacterium]
MTKSNFDLMLFDLVGTTVEDSGSGSSAVIECFAEIFVPHGLALTQEEINPHRGKNKIEAIRNLLIENDLSPEMTETMNLEFNRLLKEKIKNFSPMDGVEEVFGLLKSVGVKTAIGSGLPEDFCILLLNELGWGNGVFDYTGSSESLGAGRPDPVMIKDAMQKLGITDKRRVLKVGDTASDILEGKNAGVKTAAVLTGTQSRAGLEALTPDYVLDSVKDIAGIV